MFDNVVKVSEDIICKIGRKGVSKSLVFGLYDIDAPKTLKENEIRNYCVLKTMRELNTEK